MRQPSHRRFTDPAKRDATIEDYQVGFDRLSANLGELRDLFKFGDSLKARFDESDAKLDLILELSAKIDWTKYRKTQLEQDKSDD